mgnify:FL=1
MLLKNLCSFNKGIQIKRDLTSIDYVIPYLHYGDLYKKYNVKLNLDEIHSEIIKVDNSFYNSKYQINNNDIVMNLTSENYDDLGKCIIVKNSENKPFLAGMETHLIKIHSSSIIPEYLNYYFESDSFLKCIQQFITGMKVFRVKPTDILNIDISLPNLQYQQHIVDIIGSLDDKIENNNKIIEKLQIKIDFIFNQFYTNILESDIFIKCKLKEYAKKIITGTTPSTKEDKYWGNSIDFITIPDMQNNVYVLDTIRKLSTECEKSFNNRIVPQNSIAISCIATVGLVSIIPHNAITNQQINSVIFNDENDCYYFYELFKTMKENLIQLGSGGSATLNINKNIFSNIEVIVPYKNEMEQFCKKTNSLFELILSLTKENTKLNDLKQLYLKKFFG